MLPGLPVHWSLVEETLYTTEVVRMDVRQEIPVKSFSIAAYVCRVVSGRGRYLVIRRSTP
jgi:hypothetical protein